MPSERETVPRHQSPVDSERTRGRAWSRLLLAGLFLEIGFVLLFVPWSRYWDRNYFVEVLPLLQPVVSDPFLRGAVSGLGVINLAAGVAELAALFASGRAPASPQASGPRVSRDRPSA